jgi:hypothetical protein
MKGVAAGFGVVAGLRAPDNSPERSVVQMKPDARRIPSAASK